MRRAAAAIIGTIAGTTLLVGAKLGATTPQQAAATTDLGGPVADDTSPSTQPSPGASAITGVPGKPVPSTSATGPTPTTTTPGVVKTTTPPASGGLASGTFHGSAVQEHYGTITVTVTVSGGKLTDVSATCGGCNSESKSISSNAFTKLRQEALTAQSASIATVSGATYTSGAYRTSLQAAINAAKA